MFSEVAQQDLRIAQSAIRPVNYRTLSYDFGTFEIEEMDMRTVWPAGDSIPRDNETLVVFLSRKGNPDYVCE